MPNFSFRDGPCSFYSGSKALGEEVIANIGQSYVWRLRIPFDEFDNKRNYLSKVQRYQKVYENVNSVSHRADFVRASWQAHQATYRGFSKSEEAVGHTWHRYILCAPA